MPSKSFSPESPLHSTLSCWVAADRFYTKAVGIGTKQISVFNNSHGYKLLKLLHGATINKVHSEKVGSQT